MGVGCVDYYETQQNNLLSQLKPLPQAGFFAFAVQTRCAHAKSTDDRLECSRGARHLGRASRSDESASACQPGGAGRNSGTAWTVDRERVRPESPP